MTHRRLAAHCCRMVVAICLVSTGDVCYAQDAWTHDEKEPSGDPRFRAANPPSPWQKLRETIRGRRRARRADEPNQVSGDPSRMLAQHMASSSATGKRAAPAFDPGVLPAAMTMQVAGTQVTPTAGLTPDAQPIQQPQDEPAPSGVAPQPIQPPQYQVGPAGTAAQEPPAGFGQRLFNAYFKKEEEEKEEEEAEEGVINRRVNLPSPFAPSPPFPFADHTGPNIGVNDTSVYPFMQAVYEGPNGDWWKKSRIKFYGWADPSYNASTSRNSNIPMSYNIVPNSIQLSQLIWIFERPLDTVQTDHFDWGFKFTELFGIDYRYTTGKGYFSDQLLKENHLYGYDPLQMYLDLYLPGVALGTVIRMGRYISPIDIEAQLSPENYLYTHSLMYTYDPYTFTGIQFITLWTSQFTTMLGVHGGNDMAPWTAASQPNGEILAKWVSTSGKDALFGGLDSIGHGYYSHGHDDLQVLACTYTHKFTDKFHTLTEAYYIWERNARVGGTVTYGPPEPYFPSVGPGAALPGLSYSIGVVNYTAYALSDKSYIVWRNDVLDDPRG
jgi:hypothetical protein